MYLNTCFRIDSMMLLDEGFQVVSVDASDKMLKHALKARWEKRKDPRYDEWGKVNTALNIFYSYRCFLENLL